MFVFAVVVPSAAVWNTAPAVLYWLFFLVWVWVFLFDALAVWTERREELGVDEEEEEDEEVEEETEEKKRPQDVVQFPCWHVGRGSTRQLALLVGFPLAVLSFCLRWRVFWWEWQVTGVAGASSGSTVVDDATVLYSAAGFFGRSTEWFAAQAAYLGVYSYFAATTCVFDSAQARWGDDNGLPAAICYPRSATQPGYPDVNASPCPAAQSASCLATNASQNYPNPAFCLAGGMFMGLNRTVCGNAALCPGSVLGPEGTIVGRSVCPYCIAYERAHNGWADPNTAYCPLYPATDPDAANNWWVCAVLCPAASLRLGVGATRSAVASFDITTAWLVQRWLLGLARDTRRLSSKPHVVSAPAPAAAPAAASAGI